MDIDIINITAAELAEMTVMEQKLIRTAQQKKNELLHKKQKNVEEYTQLIRSNNSYNASIWLHYQDMLNEEYTYQVELLREQLMYNLSVHEPTSGEETGGSGSDNTGYAVDYELSYIERYIEVRDYYMAIPDPNERLTLLAADTVAQKYLGTYYSTLFNYVASFT